MTLMFSYVDAAIFYADDKYLDNIRVARLLIIHTYDLLETSILII